MENPIKMGWFGGTTILKSQVTCSCSTSWDWSSKIRVFVPDPCLSKIVISAFFSSLVARNLVGSLSKSGGLGSEMPQKGVVMTPKTYQNWTTSCTRWFKVTFLYPIWRSLNLWKGHLTIPKRSHRIARQEKFRGLMKKIPQSYGKQSLHQQFWSHPKRWKIHGDFPYQKIRKNTYPKKITN